MHVVNTFCRASFDRVDYRILFKHLACTRSPPSICPWNAGSRCPARASSLRIFCRDASYCTDHNRETVCLRTSCCDYTTRLPCDIASLRAALHGRCTLAAVNRADAVATPAERDLPYLSRPPILSRPSHHLENLAGVGSTSECSSHQLCLVRSRRSILHLPPPHDSKRHRKIVCRAVRGVCTERSSFNSARTSHAQHSDIKPRLARVSKAINGTRIDWKVAMVDQGNGIKQGRELRII
jgi:hypothetical protein